MSSQNEEPETPATHVAPVTREALSIVEAAAAAAAEAELSALGERRDVPAPASQSQRQTPLSFTGSTVSTLRVPFKRPRLNALGSRPIRSSTPSISYHISTLGHEAHTDQNFTFEELEERQSGHRTLRDPTNPSFILRRG